MGDFIAPEREDAIAELDALLTFAQAQDPGFVIVHLVLEFSTQGLECTLVTL